jgi:hypothetical protein
LFFKYSKPSSFSCKLDGDLGGLTIEPIYIYRYDWNVNAFGFGWGIKEALIQSAVASQRGISMNKVNTISYLRALGAGGAKYMRYVKAVGYVGGAISAINSGATAAEYYNNGGTGWKVGVKATIDMAMTGVGFLGPVGFGVSAAYYLVDYYYGETIWAN